MSSITIADALQQMLNNSAWKGRYIQSKLRLEWETIVGKTISKYTDEVKLIDHTLVIKTHVAALKNELQMSKPFLITQVNDYLGENYIKEVIIS
jgi:predicted nucleic acid-binding Zn ribbon protein